MSLSCPLRRSIPTFLSHLSFLKEPYRCQQLSPFLIRFSFSSILDTTSHVFPPRFTLSISQYRLAFFLTFALPFFQHGFPPSTFLDSPLSCGVPLAVPPSSVTPTSYFSMPPYPPRFVARCFLPPQGYKRRYLRAQHVHRSILAHLRSCQAGYIPAAASMPYPARVRVRSHYTLPRR